MSNEEPVENPAAGDPIESAADSVEPHEPVEVRTQMEVGLQRSVRIGPIMIGGAVLGAVIAAIITMLFPVVEDGHYTLGQVVGFVAVLGAVIGLTLGAILALILSAVARRRKGAAIAVLTDVR